MKWELFPFLDSTPVCNLLEVLLPGGKDCRTRPEYIRPGRWYRVYSFPVGVAPMVSVVYHTSLLLVFKVARLTITLYSHYGRREHPEAPRVLP